MSYLMIAILLVNIFASSVNAWQASRGLNRPGSIYAATVGLTTSLLLAIVIVATWGRI